MTDSNILIRIDKNLKKEFDALCKDIGITMSSALIMFIKKSVRENRIPFDLTGKRFSKEMIEDLKVALNEYPFDDSSNDHNKKRKKKD